MKGIGVIIVRLLNFLGFFSHKVLFTNIKYKFNLILNIKFPVPYNVAIILHFSIRNYEQNGRFTFIIVNLIILHIFDKSYNAYCFTYNTPCPYSSFFIANNKMRPEPDSVLPTPKHILFPAENVKLGWQDSSHPVGAGMFNVGNTCYLNSTLQVG